MALPARCGALGADPLRAFAAIESRCVWQARTAILVAGASGFYIVWRRLDLWSTFGELDFWWMDAMVGLWLLFAFHLFPAEPFTIERVFHGWAEAEPERSFALLHRAHWLLLMLSVIVVLGRCRRERRLVIFGYSRYQRILLTRLFTKTEDFLS